MIKTDDPKYMTELEKLKARNRKQKKYIHELRKEILVFKNALKEQEKVNTELKAFVRELVSLLDKAEK